MYNVKNLMTCKLLLLYTNLHRPSEENMVRRAFEIKKKELLEFYTQRNCNFINP